MMPVTYVQSQGSESRSDIVTFPAMETFQDVDVTGECLALQNLGNNLQPLGGTLRVSTMNVVLVYGWCVLQML